MNALTMMRDRTRCVLGGSRPLVASELHAPCLAAACSPDWMELPYYLPARQPCMLKPD